MNRLIDKYGYKGAQDVMQFVSFTLGIAILILLIIQVSLLSKNNKLLSDLTNGDAVLTIGE